MATMMNERYAVEEGEEEGDVSYTSFKTISTVETSDGEQTKCEEQCNTAFTSYQTISTVRTWNEEDDTQAENSTDSPCISQSSLISTCRKNAASHDYYSGLSFKRSKVDGSLFNLNQMNGTFQVLMDVEEHISSSSCGSCPDPSLKQPTDPMVPGRIKKLGDRITALQQLVAPFGKADTASVLLESIGYIMFLQQEVEVLLNRKDRGDIELDLKSQGLCLVPIACTPHEVNREYASFLASKLEDQETNVMATVMNEGYAAEEGEEEYNVSYTSFKTISTIKTSDGEQKKYEEQCNTAFTSYQTVPAWREKLGVRIDALHQLVSPFGKADTASVLMDSIDDILWIRQSQL